MTHNEETIPLMNIDDTDWSSMAQSEQICHLEVEGFLVLPAELIARIESKTGDAC